MATKSAPNVANQTTKTTPKTAVKSTPKITTKTTLKTTQKTTPNTTTKNIAANFTEATQMTIGDSLKERFIETLLVADHTLFELFQSLNQNLEKYLLSVFNMVTRYLI